MAAPAEDEERPTLLYHQTLVPTQNITHAVEGSFTLPDAQDMLLVRHRTLELWTLHPDTGTLECVHTVPLFASVYAMVAVARTTSVHHVAITSETGYVTLLRYELDAQPTPTRLPLHSQSTTDPTTTTTVLVLPSLRGRWVKVGEVCLGRAGARLTVSGARMAVDVGGTALFVAALMRHKALIPLRHVEPVVEGDADDTTREEKTVEPAPTREVVVLGAPLEVERQTVTFALCALEGLPETAAFAALEEDLCEADTAASNANPTAFLKLSASRRRYLVVYVYSASLGQVQRTHLVQLTATAHRLVPVPGAPCGPGGVLVCGATELTWYDLSMEHTSSATRGNAATGVFKCAVAMPRRVDFARTWYDPFIVQHTVTCVGQDFFLLLQDEQGDLFRVLLGRAAVQRAYDAIRAPPSPTTAAVANPLAVHYFDSLPPSACLVLFRKGYLFAAAESGAVHGLHKITRNGYAKEDEYIVKRVRRTRPSRSDTATDDVKGIAVKHPRPTESTTAMAPPSRPRLGARVVAVYEPHRALRHMVLVQSFANTPAIAAFVPHISHTEHDVAQRQVQMTAVAGRGEDGVVLLARYGVATRREARYTLPAVFTSVVALESAAALRRRTSESATTRSRRRALAAPVWTDKLLLCTAQGTSVYAVGSTVEPDSLSGFVTTERTLAACTLRDGVGYVQVTATALVVLGAGDDAATVQPTTWTHPHGKSVLAAAATSTQVLLSFHQGGGLASFDLGLTGTALRQCDAVPTFPASPAVALLTPPSLARSADHVAALGTESVRTRPRLELAAVATLGQEVYLFDPRRLREPLARLVRDRPVATSAITSLLLTYFGGDDAAAATPRLFCLVGHLDGLLARYELDATTAQVVDLVEVSCGTAPVRLVAGDGETVCYAMSGTQTWRCAMQEGVVQVVPWRFAQPQTAFARFIARPVRDDAEVKSEQDESDVVTVRSTERYGEWVVAVRERELGLFAALHRSHGAHGLDYSLTTHALPVAGRRLLRHPTRDAYVIILGSVHRGLSGPHAAHSLGSPDVYTSTLQLLHEPTSRLSPPYYFDDGDAVLAMAVGAFSADFGQEPVMVVAVAAQYTHGAGCHAAASCAQGWLRTFRFLTNATDRAGSLFNADGSPVLRFAPLHNTLLRNDADVVGPADYASALHICPDVGLLFVGLGPGNGLRVYGWGQQHFLRKRHLPCSSRIVAIDTVFARAPAGDGRGPWAYYCADLYRCPVHDTAAARRARERALLVVCATVARSILVVSLRPGERDTPSYLLQIAQDRVPRALTCMAVVDERTIAVGDRAGNVTFLRLPETTRFAFAQRVDQLTDAELTAAQRYLREEQVVQEVASHAVHAVVTDLRVQSHDPSAGADPSLAVKMVLYSTSEGRIGAYVPFVAEEDAVLAAYVQPLLASRVSLLLLPQNGALPVSQQGSDPTGVTTSAVPSHHVIDDDLLQLYRRAATEVLSAQAKAEVDEELERISRMVQARRRVLALPPQTLPSVREFMAKQRALITLPQ